jgi:hypothetical protein
MCEKPILFGGRELGAKRHICAFFNTPEEEYDVLMPFIKEGLERGEKAFHVIAPKMSGYHLKRLDEAGIDSGAARQSGQLEFCDWDEAYFPDGRFDQDRMLGMWQESLAAAQANGFPRTRLVAHMEWSREDRDGVNDLLEYEARYNLQPRQERDVVVCTYDLNRYSGALIMDIMRTHPMILLGGILYENPFYVPPDQFIEELKGRGGARGSSVAA